MIKWTISTIFISPKGMLKYHVYSVHYSTFLVVKNHLFALWNACNLYLIYHSYWHWEKYAFTNINFVCAFYIYFCILFFFILYFDHRWVHNKNIILFNMWFVSSDLCQHSIAHVSRHCNHSIFNSHSINGIFCFSSIVFQQL
jgi:hypothetical protein